MSEAFITKLSREGELLSSLPSQIPHGLAEAIDDAWQNKARTAFEIGSAVVLGTAFTLLSRNPNQIIQQGIKYSGMAFTGLAALDLGSRFYGPMNDTWQNGANLNADKSWLGRNVGDAIFNYGIAVGAGSAGAYFGEQSLSRTRFGEILSGQKVSHFNGSSGNGFESVQDKFDSYTQNFLGRAQQSKPDLSNYTVRQFNDGSKLVTSSNGLAMLRPSSGEELWFKTRQDWWSPLPKVEALPGNPFKSAIDDFGIGGNSFLHNDSTLKFASGRTPAEKPAIDVGTYTNKLFALERGSEGGIGALASEWAFERAGDIGSAILQHKLLLKLPQEDDHQDAKDKPDGETSAHTVISGGYSGGVQRGELDVKEATESLKKLIGKK